MSTSAATLSMAAAKAAPTDRVRVAVIGLNGRGNDHIRGWLSQPDVDLVALCDIDQHVLDKRIGEVEKRTSKKVKAYSDLRKLFEDKEVDAVSVATPNHWHALAAIWACQHEKDVYVEKPATHNVVEGRRLVEAAHKYKRIVQHGVQLRSSEALREGVELLRKGVIGDVYMSRGLVFRWRASIGKKNPESAPDYIDWNLWQGPAQERQFSRRYVHYNWHWHWDYGNGDVGNQGIHETDMCMWGLGVNSLPSRVTGMGGKFLFDDDKETPEVLTTIYHYPEQKKIIQFEVRHWCTNLEDGAGVGNIFYGKDGYMVIKGYDSYEVFLGDKREKGPARKKGGDHYANFVKAVKSRNTADQHGPVETAHMASALAHLGNISYRLGRQLDFDPVKERFSSDDHANAMLTRKYRKPFVVPDKV